ncbi:hypothetical protein V8E55_001131 [Tylopilus felleus]
MESRSMVRLSREDAQTLIYRGCARLAKAMQIKNIIEDAAQEWEEQVVKEAKQVITAAMSGPIMEVRIPPLPLALLEVQRKLDKQRPMRPSDIHSPYEQASSSYYVTLMTRENDSEIPSDVDLGDPTSFWWNDLEEKGGTLNDEETNLYVYVPKCERCRDLGLVCRTVKPEFVCTQCKLRKRRCSARGGASTVMPTNKQTRMEKSQSTVDMLRSQGATSATGSLSAGLGETLTVTEHKGTVSTPSKRERVKVYVAVPPPTFKPSVRPVEKLNIGPPGGKWKWQERAERAAAARSPFCDSLDSLFQSSTARSTPATCTSATPSESMGNPISNPIPDTRLTPASRVLVDKAIATENSPLEQLSHRQMEMLKALASFLETVHQDRP